MVDSIRLFDLATKQADWLSIRQSTVANNVANANTPGYRAKDVKPFSQILNSGTSAITMSRTNPRHIESYSDMGVQEIVDGDETQEITHSGNNVSIEDEMRKGSEISQNISMNTAIVKSFQHMLLSSLK